MKIISLHLSPLFVKFSNLTMPTLALSVLLLSIFCSAAETLSPVILIPGLGGNQMFAKLQNFKPNHWYCKKNTGWDNVWVNLVKMEFTSCFVDSLKLHILENGTTTNQDGVETRILAFGDTSSVEWLSPVHVIRERFRKELGYFVELVDRLVNHMSYERNVTVRGAPYDFRKAPNEMSGYMEDLTSLIEETYEMNGKTKVVLIGHSLGGNVVLYFLHSKTQEWKDKYISTFISLGSPWAGSLKAMKLIASGDTMDVPKIIVGNSLNMRPLQRSMPSAAWLMPYNSKWHSNEVLITSPFRNYTIDDYDAFYDDIDFKEGKILRKKTENLLQSSIGPGVKMHCLYGMDEANTADRYIYKKKKSNWSDVEPNIEYGPGDTTVNKRSLEVCKEWPDTKTMGFKGVTHFGILFDAQVIDYIENVLSKL